MAEEPGLVGKRWLLPGLASLTLNGLHQGSLLATDVGAGAAPDLNGEVPAAARHVVAQKPSVAGVVDGLLGGAPGLGILASNVQVAVLCSHRQSGDDHRFDDGVGIAVQQQAVFESAGL